MEKKNKHEVWELRQWQSLPLSVKIRMSAERIRNWVNYYGQDGVYISFSGGKDSTVLLDLVRNYCGYKRVPAMFVNVPTQYPELKTFAESFDNVDVVAPKISFMEVCEKYGFPLISKEVSECVYGAKKYLSDITSKQASKQDTLISTENLKGLASTMQKDFGKGKQGSPFRLAKMLGMLTKDNQIQENIPEGNESAYAQTKYKFLLEAPFDVSNQCCTIMKKSPAHTYHRKTGRMPITAQMACESRVRLQQWIRNGCNGFDMKLPVSNPLSFWTENDILEYIYWYDLPICPVYGKVVIDRDKMENVEGFTDGELAERPDCMYKTTGCDRTGCMLCGFGCHLEKSPNRFEMLKETHPGMYGMLDRVKNKGVTMREAIDWINENSELDIKY